MAKNRNDIIRDIISAFGYTPAGLNRNDLLDEWLTSIAGPINVSPPSISGVGYNGGTLSASPGSWDNAVSVSGQWQANGLPILGETGLFYTVDSSTEGSELSYVEKAFPGNVTVESNTIHHWIPTDMVTDFWVDASDLGTLTTVGNKVSQWDDKSGNLNHLTQSTGSLQPTTGTRSLNGLNVLEGNGTEKIDNATFSLNKNFEVMLVLQRDNGAVSFQRPWGASGTSDAFATFRASTNIDKITTFIGTTSVATTGDYDGNDSPFIYSSKFDGSSIESFAFGESTGSKSVTSYDLERTSFELFKGVAGNNLDGFIGEVIIFSPLEDNRLKLSGYLAWKWGLVTDLSSGHPYKNSPPTV